MPVCLCVCAKAIRRTCKDLIHSFQYPSIDLDERTSLGAGPSPTSPPPSAVGNFTSSGSAPGTGATKAAMPCRQTDRQTDRQTGNMDKPERNVEQRDRVSGYQDSAVVGRGGRIAPWPAARLLPRHTPSAACLPWRLMAPAATLRLQPLLHSVAAARQTRMCNAVFRQLAQSREILPARSAHYDHGVWR